MCRSPGGTGLGTCARSAPTAWAPRWTARSSPPAMSDASRSGAPATCTSARRAPRLATSARPRTSASASLTAAPRAPSPRMSSSPSRSSPPTRSPRAPPRWSCGILSNSSCSLSTSMAGSLLCCTILAKCSSICKPV